MKFLRLFIALLLLLTACEPQVEVPRLQITPFPTMTAGYMVEGEMPSEGVIPLAGSGLSSPATAVAISRQPTATPDLGACPTLNRDVSMETTPPQAPSIVVEEIQRYLTLGGDAVELSVTLRDDWQIVGETGFFRSDIDLTGEGTPEVITAYVPPNGSGTLLVFGCQEGVYTLLYQGEAETPDPPRIITNGDVNNNQVNDLLFGIRQCLEDENGELIPDECEYRIRLITWQRLESRFADLIEDEVTATELPTINDIDNDRVSEIIVQLQNRGSSITGPLRTGTNIYDWNGTAYVLSIAQPDPPRFRIQVIHEADKMFDRREVQISLPMYREALDETNDLRFWFDDEPEILKSYSLYRLLLAQIVAADIGSADTYQTILTLYPDPAVEPVYASMGRALMENFQTTNNISSACDAVQDIISQRGEAVDLLNRYGTRSPTYTALDLCPF